MELSNNLTSQFAKLNNNDTPSSGELVYGTTVMQGSKLFVNIDGSDTITPVVTTSDVKPGERVTVMIKDHSATIMGNITNPSAGTEEMGKVLDEYDTIIAKLGNFELVVADKVSTEQLEAELAIIDEALIGKASIAELDAVKATIKDLDVEELQADIARIDEAIIKKADITDLDAVHAEIDTLEGNVADINTIIGGNLTMDNIQSLVLTTSKVTVDNAFIKDAMIDRVSASKLTAGTINTSLINIGSEDGAMTITGSLQQFKDADGNVRIQIGKDSTGDFTFALYGADGQGQLINQNGITASAIEDGLIVNDMVAENAAIAGNKLDISSVIEEINDSTTTIKSSKIIFDDEGQTLDVAFNQLKTDIEEGSVPDSVLEQITTNTTSIGVMQGEINTLISNTTIVNENGETVQMKDDYSAFKITVDGMSSKIGSLETTSEQTSSKLSTIEQTLDSFETELSEVSNTTEQTSSKLSTMEQTLDSFEVRISDTETTNETLSQDVASLKLTNEEFEVEIAKKTDKDSIISTINASTEGITISSSKVNIPGFVEFSDLSTAGYTTINGANITTGYISCNRLKGGTVSAADEINFVGGARIFGNEGELDAGLTVSAAGITLSGGAINFLYGSWYLPTGDLTIDSGDLVLSSGCDINCYTIDATSISCSSISSSGNISATGTIYGSNMLALARGTLWAGVGSATRDYLRFGSHILSSDSSYGVLLTDSGGSWATVRCGSVIANGTTLSSDIRLKTDIKYVNLDAQSIDESGLASPNVNLTTEDMHSFIETLPIASYRLKNDVENGIDKTYYGFIAQDILYTKVGSELIEYDVVEVTPPTKDEEGNVIEEGVYDDKGLKYSENKFIAFVCGALQEEIRQRKELEQEVMSLKEIIEKGE